MKHSNPDAPNATMGPKAAHNILNEVHTDQSPKTMKTLLVLAMLCVGSLTHAGTITNLVVSNLTAQRVTKSISLTAGQSAKLLSYAAEQIQVFRLVQIIGGVPVTRLFSIDAMFYGPCAVW